MDQILFDFAFAGYCVGMMLFLGYGLTRREALASAGKWTLVGTVICHGFSLAIRAVIGRRLPQHSWYMPWSNWFESFSFFAIVIVGVYLVVQRRRGIPILGAFVTPLAVLAMTVAIRSPFGTQIPNLSPGLQSFWMVIHVPVMFLSYALFANAFAVGIVFLLQERQIKSRRPSNLMLRLPALNELDDLIYKIIMTAFPILTLGILLGARWAYDAWGRYWGWDPKETWSFITWLTYLIYLHMRLMAGWRGRKTAYLSLAGFALVIVTYIGVNYLSPLHGFLSNGGK